MMSLEVVLSRVRLSLLADVLWCFIEDFHVSFLVEQPFFSFFGVVSRVVVVGVGGLRQRRKIEFVVETKGL